MINLIYGAKGSGKTKKLIEKANAIAETSKGIAVYMTDVSEHSLSLKNSIRFINVNEFGVCCESCMKGFIKGLIAGNSDITTICVDGIARFLNQPIDQLGHLFSQLEAIGDMYKIDFVITVSAAEVPKFLKKYI